MSSRKVMDAETQAVVDVFDTWVAGLTVGERASVENAVRNAQSLHNIGPASAKLLVAEVLLYLHKRRPLCKPG